MGVCAATACRGIHVCVCVCDRAQLYLHTITWVICVCDVCVSMSVSACMRLYACVAKSSLHPRRLLQLQASPRMALTPAPAPAPPVKAKAGRMQQQRAAAAAAAAAAGSAAPSSTPSSSSSSSSSLLTHALAGAIAAGQAPTRLIQSLDLLAIEEAAAVREELRDCGAGSEAVEGLVADIASE